MQFEATTGADAGAGRPVGWRGKFALRCWSAKPSKIGLCAPCDIHATSSQEFRSALSPPPRNPSWQACREIGSRAETGNSIAAVCVALPPVAAARQMQTQNYLELGMGDRRTGGRARAWADLVPRRCFVCDAGNWHFLSNTATEWWTEHCGRAFPTAVGRPASRRRAQSVCLIHRAISILFEDDAVIFETRRCSFVRSVL